MKSLVPWEPGLFYRLEQGHTIVLAKQEPGEYQLGSKFNIVCMFDMYDLLRDDQKVGYFFLSGMKVQSKGSHIITYMETKRGQADSFNLVIRSDEFLLFDFPNRGAMAISTKVNQHVQRILEGQ
jgi:hypothetical protein